MSYICEEELCTSCSACLNVCPTNCIAMQENSLGELHPVIEQKHCIECNRCKRVCPVNKKLDFVYPLECYAAWIKDRGKRGKCASGGIATVLSEYVINELGGVVYGTRYDNELNPICSRVNEIVDLEYLKGSKYVQSSIGDAYKKVRNDLINNIYVLFIGTPCQVAGLKSFLNFDYEKLFVCDLICHGVSPASYFKKEVNYLKDQYKITNLTDCRFRGNDGFNFKLTLWDNDKLRYKRHVYSQYYFSSFLKAISLHESCYRCKYAQEKRVSDLTIGDFLGIGNVEPFIYPKENVSVVILNTPKSIDLWMKISKKEQQLVSTLRSYNEAVNGGISLRQPFPRHRHNEKFRTLYKEYGWVKSIRKILWKDVLISQVLNSPISYIWRIPRKLYRLTFHNFK